MDELARIAEAEDEGEAGPRRRKRRTEQTKDYVVAIVLGKALCRSRLSVEHAARLGALARAIRDGRLQPDLIMFTASAASMALTNPRDDATTACTYFLHLCESVGVDVDSDKIHVTHTPVTTRDGMAAVLGSAIVPRLRRDQALHCAFFASSYQLSRLERIGAITPRLSLFAPLAARRDAHASPRGFVSPTNRGAAANSSAETEPRRRRGRDVDSWSRQSRGDARDADVPSRPVAATPATWEIRGRDVGTRSK